MATWTESATSGDGGWTVHCRWDDGDPEAIDAVEVKEPGDLDPNGLRLDDYMRRVRGALLAYGVDLDAVTIDTNVQVGDGGSSIFPVRRRPS